MFRYVFALLLAAFIQPGVAHACPDLQVYYSEQFSWSEKLRDLRALMPECLQSSEYFALRGAAELNTNRVDAALESLERSLLLDPGNAAARIDYAQVLFSVGQVFAAMELNEELLARPDLPQGIDTLLQNRQSNWRAMTRQRSYQVDISTGYDDNLNGAPDPSQITLTLSGEPITLNLNDDFRPIGDTYGNLRLGTRYRQLGPGSQHNWVTELRARNSSHEDSNLLQLDNRYVFSRNARNATWQLGGSLSSLHFGGNPLFTATEARYRRQSRNDGNSSCHPLFDLAVQHQNFHGQAELDAVETRAAIGANCILETASGNQSFNIELGLLDNSALSSRRPGGHRGGWQARADWQTQAGIGTFRSQVSYTEINDRKAFSPLLANGAKREVSRAYVYLQYLQPLSLFGPNTTLLVNLFHQQQKSNLELFESTDSSFEIGLSFSF